MTTKSTTRTEVQRLRERPRAQVLVVGGGINGLGTFRDLALQGVDVVLVERNDFVSGASAASSHMIHGGIRYLENGEFRLVKESVTERNGLLKIAPHYVKPLETTIPIFSTFSGILAAPLRFLTHKQGKPKERGAFLIKTGLTIYDSFSRDGGSVPRHSFHGRKKSLEILPQLNPGLNAGTVVQLRLQLMLAIPVFEVAGEGVGVAQAEGLGGFAFGETDGFDQGLGGLGIGLDQAAGSQLGSAEVAGDDDDRVVGMMFEDRQNRPSGGPARLAVV